MGQLPQIPVEDLILFAGKSAGHAGTGKSALGGRQQLA
jgi:hypothetical protein